MKRTTISAEDKKLFSKSPLNFHGNISRRVGNIRAVTLQNKSVNTNQTYGLTQKLREILEQIIIETSNDQTKGSFIRPRVADGPRLQNEKIQLVYSERSLAQRDPIPLQGHHTGGKS